jgi:hypothetical protein
MIFETYSLSRQQCTRKRMLSTVCMSVSHSPICRSTKNSLISLPETPHGPRLPDARPMAGQGSVSHAKAFISDDNLPLPMDGLCHHHHRLCSWLHVVVLCRECPGPTVGLLRSILTFDQLDLPKDWLATIPVGNGVILIAKRAKLTGDAHEPLAKLREPRVQ